MTHRCIWLVALSLLVAHGAWAGEEEDKVLKPGKDAPAVNPLKLIQGDLPDLKTETGCVLVEFWATWCVPCMKSIPHLNKLYGELKDRGLQIIAVSEEEDKIVSEFVKKKGVAMSYPIASDKDGEMANNWLKAANQEGIPCAFLVGRGGRVLWIGNPLDEKFEPTLRKALTGRYDPVMRKKTEPMIDAARKCVDVRNWTEGYKHYDEAIETDPRLLLDITIERFKVTLLKEKNPKAAGEWLVDNARKRYGSDPVALQELVNMIVKDPEVVPRDVAVAAAIAEVMGTKGGSRAMETQAVVAFAQGDQTKAVELQTDAWMTADPIDKASIKRTLDEYRASGKRGTAAAGKPNGG